MGSIPTRLTRNIGALSSSQVQDIGLSRRRRGFKSRWGHQPPGLTAGGHCSFWRLFLRGRRTTPGPEEVSFFRSYPQRVACCAHLRSRCSLRSAALADARFARWTVLRRGTLASLATRALRGLFRLWKVASVPTQSAKADLLARCPRFQPWARLSAALLHPDARFARYEGAARAFPLAEGGVGPNTVREGGLAHPLPTVSTVGRPRPATHAHDRPRSHFQGRYAPTRLTEAPGAVLGGGPAINSLTP